MAKLSYAERKTYATAFRKGSPRFPMPDVSHARSALASIPRAKDLPVKLKKVIAQRAANILEEITPEAKKYGVKKLTKSRRAAISQFWSATTRKEQEGKY